VDLPDCPAHGDLRDLVIVGQKPLQRLDLPIGRINCRNLPRTQWGMVVLDLP
jgi:hypothetical protein